MTIPRWVKISAGFLCVGFLAVSAKNLPSAPDAPVIPTAAQAQEQQINYATESCRRAIPAFAEHEFKWDPSNGTEGVQPLTIYYLMMSGTKAQMRDKFGNWARAGYMCIFDTRTNTVYSAFTWSPPAGLTKGRNDGKKVSYVIGLDVF